MSKKRFENRNKRFKPIKNYGKAVNEVFIKDTINNWYISSEDDVVDLLNSLAEENEQLKHWKKRMIEYLSDWFNKTEYLSVLNKITEINNEIGFDSDE